MRRPFKLLCIATALCVIGRGTTNGTSKANTLRRSRLRVSCPFGNHENWYEAYDPEKARNIMCATAKRSSCDLCASSRVKFPFTIKTNKQISNIFKNAPDIVISRPVTYGDETVHVVCTIETEREGRVLAVEAKCRKSSRKPGGIAPCSWLKNIKQCHGRLECPQNKPLTVTCPSSNSVTLTGGIVGGVLGGVVIVGVIVVWWIRRRKRSIGDQTSPAKRDSHIYLGLTPRSVPDKISTSVSVSTVVRMSRTTVTEETSTNEYQELPDIPEYRFAKGMETDSNKTKIVNLANLGDQKLDELDNGIYSKEKATSRPLPSPFPEPQDSISQNGKESKDTYNRLGDISETASQEPDVHNKAGPTRKDAETMQSFPEHGKETKDTYNRLGAISEITSHEPDAYNKAGPAMKGDGTVQSFPEHGKETKDTYNRLGAISEITSQEPDAYNKAGPAMKGDGTIQPVPEYGKDVQDMYNRLRIDSDTSYQNPDRHSKSGSAVKEDGMTKSLTEYFVLEKDQRCQDTYNEPTSS